MSGIGKTGLARQTYYVYIITNKSNSVLYTGVTSDLAKRIIEHREKKYGKSYTARYNLDKLVYYETFGDINMAIAREKQIKGGSRLKKIALIENLNPNWLDLFESKIGTDFI